MPGGVGGGGGGALPPTRWLSTETGTEPRAFWTVNASLIVEPASVAWTVYVDRFVR